MVVCPKCKEVIEYLISPATATDNAQMNENGEIIYPEEPEWETDDWECSNCGETLFRDISEAENFMKNTDKLKKILEKKIKNEKK